jgi:hypothetical protein
MTDAQCFLQCQLNVGIFQWLNVLHHVLHMFQVRLGNFSKIENFMDFIVERNNRHENRRIVQLIHFRKNSQDSVQCMNDMLHFCSAVSG